MDIGFTNDINKIRDGLKSFECESDSDNEDNSKSEKIINKYFLYDEGNLQNTRGSESNFTDLEIDDIDLDTVRHFYKKGMIIYFVLMGIYLFSIY